MQRTDQHTGTLRPGKRAPRTNHLEKCPDGGEPRYDVGASGVRVCDCDDGPREGEELLKGIEEVSPRPVVPVRVFVVGVRVR